MQTLQHIYDYTNRLLSDELDDLTDIIDYLNKGQNIIADKIGIEAQIYTVELTSNEITLPDDYLKFSKATHRNIDAIDDIPINIESMWGGKLYLAKEVVSGTFKLYYFKRPADLVASIPTQEPDIDSKYLYALCEYAAAMYKLSDEDTEMQSIFENNFIRSVQQLSPGRNAVTKFTNVW